MTKKRKKKDKQEYLWYIIVKSQCDKKKDIARIFMVYYSIVKVEARRMSDH